MLPTSHSWLRVLLRLPGSKDDTDIVNKAGNKSCEMLCLRFRTEFVKNLLEEVKL
jgi:hypothetical protein